jgi:hypothetical protein
MIVVAAAAGYLAANGCRSNQERIFKSPRNTDSAPAPMYVKIQNQEEIPFATTALKSSAFGKSKTYTDFA